MEYPGYRQSGTGRSRERLGDLRAFYPSLLVSKVWRGGQLAAPPPLLLYIRFSHQYLTPKSLLIIEQDKNNTISSLFMGSLEKQETLPVGRASAVPIPVHFLQKDNWAGIRRQMGSWPMERSQWLSKVSHRHKGVETPRPGGHVCGCIRMAIVCHDLCIVSYTQHGTVTEEMLVIPLKRKMLARSDQPLSSTDHSILSQGSRK